MFVWKDSLRFNENDLHEGPDSSCVLKKCITHALVIDGVFSIFCSNYGMPLGLGLELVTEQTTSFTVSSLSVKHVMFDGSCLNRRNWAQ